MLTTKLVKALSEMVFLSYQKTVKFPLKLFNFKNQSTTVLLYTLMKHD